MDDCTDEDVAEDERSEPDPGDDEGRDDEGGQARCGLEVRVHHLRPQRSISTGCQRVQSAQQHKRHRCGSHATGPASAAGTARRTHGRATRTSRGRGPRRPRRVSNARRGDTLPRRRCTCKRSVRRQSDPAAFVTAQHPTADRLREAGLLEPVCRPAKQPQHRTMHGTQTPPSKAKSSTAFAKISRRERGAWLRTSS